MTTPGVLRRSLPAVAVAVGLSLIVFLVRYHWPRQHSQVPVLAYEQTVDLGDRNHGEIVVCHFRVSNNGSADLQLSDFSTSCSCAGVEYERDGALRAVKLLSIPPGQSVTLSVRISVAARPGTPQSVFVQFRTSDPVQPVAQVVVAISNVRGGLSSEPSSIAYGELPVGKSARQLVYLYDNCVEGRRIESIQPTHPNFISVRLIPQQIDNPPHRHETVGNLIGVIEVIPNTEIPRSLVSEIQVHFVGENRRPDRIPVSGDVVATVTLTPVTLLLPRFVDRKPVYTGQIQITARDGNPIRAKLLAIPDHCKATLRTDASRPGEHVLDVSVSQSSFPEDNSTRKFFIGVQIEHVDGRSEILQIPIMLDRGAP